MSIAFIFYQLILGTVVVLLVALAILYYRYLKYNNTDFDFFTWLKLMYENNNDSLW